MRATRAIVAAVVMLAGRAGADDAACVKAAEDGQRSRDEGHLVRARAELITCADQQCPSAVRADCLKWLDDVERSTPTVVVGAVANGHDVTDVAVMIDGVPIARRLDGRAIPIDPGEHHVHYARGTDAVDETVVVRVGEKDRALRVRFGKEPVGPRPKPPTWGYAFLGIGVAGLAAFGGFAAAGYTTYTKCKDESASCNIPSHYNESLAEFVVADVSLGVAAVSAVIAAWIFVRHNRAPRVTAGVGSLAITF